MTISRNAPLYLAVLIIITLLGFSQTYLNNLAEAASGHHFHFFFMLLWLAMLVAQAWFIRSRNFPWHRRVGKASYVVAPLVFWSMLVINHEGVVQNNDGVTIPELYVEVLSFYIVPLYVLAYGLAIRNRRNAALHMRYMAISGLVIIEAAVFRVFMHVVPGGENFFLSAYGGITFTTLVLAGLALIDWRREGRFTGSALPYVIFFLLMLPKYHALTYWQDMDFWLTFWEWVHTLPRLAPWETIYE